MRASEQREALLHDVEPSGGPIFVDVTEGAGIDFLHANINPGDMEVVGAAGAVVFDFDTNGFQDISYNDRSNQDQKLSHCSNQTCDSAVLSVVDSIGNSTTGTGHGTTSVAVASDGRIGISYFDANVDTLKIAILPGA